MSDRLQALTSWIAVAAALFLSGPAGVCADGTDCCRAAKASTKGGSSAPSCCRAPTDTKSTDTVPTDTVPTDSASREICGCRHAPTALSPTAPFHALLPEVEQAHVPANSSRPAFAVLYVAPGLRDWCPVQARAPPDATGLS